MTTRYIDRAIRSSVDLAQRMQPGRWRRVADATLYASPGQRSLVEDVRRAGQYLVSSGLGIRFGSVMAVRRNDRTVAVTTEGADIADVDGQCLATVAVDDSPVARAAGRVGAGVWAHPAALLALAAAGATADETTSGDLARLCGRIVSGTDLSEPGVGVVAGEGVLAVGSSAVEAVARLEAAERLATITLHSLDR